MKTLFDQPAQLHIFVSGRVQGVGFRRFVEFHATNLNLTGWVRNLANDCVEVLAEGHRGKLDQLLNLIKIGTPSSHVEKLDFDWLNVEGDYSTFQVRFSK